MNMSTFSWVPEIYEQDFYKHKFQDRIATQLKIAHFPNSIGTNLLGEKSNDCCISENDDGYIDDVVLVFSSSDVENDPNDSGTKKIQFKKVYLNEELTFRIDLLNEKLGIIPDDKRNDQLSCLATEEIPIETFRLLRRLGRNEISAQQIVEEIYDHLEHNFLKEVQLDAMLAEPDRANNHKLAFENIIYYGVPGCGKSYHVQEEILSEFKFTEKDDYVTTVTFHPEYTYADFVGQIIPRSSENNHISYPFVAGPFTKTLAKALEDPQHYYILDIEEINRGNTAAIFGDIFQLLDRRDEDNPDKADSRSLEQRLESTETAEFHYTNWHAGDSKYAIDNLDLISDLKKELAELKKKKKEATTEDIVVDLKKVFIPFNMLLVATMNTSDQGLYPLDTAFQRRWQMEYIENDLQKVKDEDKENNIVASYAGTPIEWCAFADAINKQLKEGSGADKQLGAYFIKTKDTKDDPDHSNYQYNARLLGNKVLKYLWDDAFKFGDKTVDEIFILDSLGDVEKEFRKGFDLSKIFNHNIFDKYWRK